MSVVLQVARHQLRDLARSRWLLLYGGFFFAVAFALLGLDDGAKAVVELASVVTAVVPLVSIVFGTLYLYAARDYIELLLTQPVRRAQVHAGLYLGVLVALAVPPVAGVLLAVALRGGVTGGLVLLLAVSVALAAAFLSLAFVFTAACDDRLKGAAIAIATWLAFAFLYDGAVLYVATVLEGRALERALLGASMANPVDLARIAVLLHLDASALMGYTGAVFHRFFDARVGGPAALAALSLWIAGPYVVAARLFRTKDF